MVFFDTNHHEHKADVLDWIEAINSEVGKYKRMIKQMMGGGTLDQETLDYISSRVSPLQPRSKPGKMLSMDSVADEESPEISKRLSFN